MIRSFGCSVRKSLYPHILISFVRVNANVVSSVVTVYMTSLLESVVSLAVRRVARTSYSMSYLSKWQLSEGVGGQKVSPPSVSSGIYVAVCSGGQDEGISETFDGRLEGA